MLTCSNCGRQWSAHCSRHAIPCCPGRCALAARASIPEVAVRMPELPGESHAPRFVVTLDPRHPVDVRHPRVVITRRDP